MSSSASSLSLSEYRFKGPPCGVLMPGSKVETLGMGTTYVQDCQPFSIKNLEIYGQNDKINVFPLISIARIHKMSLILKA